MLKVDLRSDPSLLAVVRSMTEQVCEVLGFSATECRSVTRAVDEALSNIIRHAYKGVSERSIQLSLSRIKTRSNGHAREGLEILLEDTGPAVDPTKLCPRPLDEVRPGGLGLHLFGKTWIKISTREAGRW